MLSLWANWLVTKFGLNSLKHYLWPVLYTCKCIWGFIWIMVLEWFLINWFRWVIIPLFKARSVVYKWCPFFLSLSLSSRQYSNKFGGPQPLPSIPSQTPQPSFDNALVPVGGRRSQLSQLAQLPGGGQLQTVGDYQTGRIQHMENRLGVAEQSNRALLEEVVRLQGNGQWVYECFHTREQILNCNDEM